jgi:hypothetical protein
MRTILILTICIAVTFAAASSQTPVAPHRKPLVAPTYYIVVEGHDEDDNTIRVHGASNLPAGANTWVQVTEFEGSGGWKDYSESVCVPLGETGILRQEVHPKQGMKFRSSLIVRAAFRTNLCDQSAAVLGVVGKKGQYLGNDNYDNAIDVSMADTKGMNDNPQVFKGSGGFFGLATIGRVQ